MIPFAKNKEVTSIAAVPADSIDNFLASSVHDMKNSVALLLTGLEKTLTTTEVDKLPTYAELVQANHDAKRIHNQLIQLLTVYKLGQKIYPFDPQYICLIDFLDELHAQYASLLAARHITLEVCADSDLYWYFDEDLVCGVIGNAINNAMRFAHNRIVISAEESGKNLVLRVEDDGHGYPDQLIRQHDDFTRGINFYEGNTGLGFYFAALVAGMHQNHGNTGKLELANAGFLGGACFILYLP